MRIETPWGAQPVAAYGPDAARAVVLVGPALGIRAAYYEQVCRGLAARGFGVVAADLPGQGESPVRARRGVGWTYEQLARDHFPAVSAAARERFDAPQIWLGHSIGGQIALMHAGLSGDVAGVALVASGVPYWRCWSGPRSLKYLGSTQAALALSSVLGFFPGEAIGFGGREATGFIRDWASVGRSGSYRLPSFDAEAALSACSVPVLATCLAGDDWAPWPAIDHALALTASPVERWTFEHDPAPDHNRWPRVCPEPIVERVATWIESLL